jgi:hypothetical protein
MARPKIGYETSFGEKVPGVTSVTGRFGDKSALVRWGWQRGRDGLELYESRDKAAELGTIVHEMVEAFIRGEDPYEVMNNADTIR